VCPQGPTKLSLRIDSISGETVTALFDFEHEPTRVHGVYLIEGLYQSGVAALVPLRWVRQPEHYSMVGLDGSVEGCTFAGRIDNESCGEFSLELRGCSAAADSD
jgi:hypothetical protein